MTRIASIDVWLDDHNRIRAGENSIGCRFEDASSDKFRYRCDWCEYASMPDTDSRLVLLRAVVHARVYHEVMLK